ncbi:glycosyltransferase family 52 [Streptococcus ruminantium]|uniref:glycosyltransferase family 52 n=1 Tax=Streptococcus ruminantium TaxID=1917441 RepID=UPI001F30C4B3|nr:glycosyltransferase family 52 [Streptococcus ruminantium]BDD43003.1 hypothetical protein GUT189_13360 [Streptococcus ruminantium]
MKKIYICHTVYHLFISLCKSNQQDTIILVDTIPNVDFLKNQISLIMRLKVCVISKTETEYPIFECESQAIYIYNDDSKIGQYLRDNGYNHHLIEEAYNYFSYNIPIKRKSLKWWIKKTLFPNRVEFGYSKFVKSIEVNDLKQVICNDYRRDKFFEVSRKTLVNNTSLVRRKEIASVFQINKIEENGIPKILVLTQPLFGDGTGGSLIKSEEEQLEFYGDIVKKYSKEYLVYFKVHPRDEIDYASFTNVLFLDKYVPMELYEFIGNYYFEIGITHSSTALESLSCVREKIFLKNLKG